MVAFPLVDNNVEAGAALIEALKKASFPFEAIFWLYTEESSDWRLIVATPLVDSKGPREAYVQLNKVLVSMKDQSDLKLWDISVRDPKDQIVKALAKYGQRADQVAGWGLTKTVVDGVYIDGAYVYRT